LLPWWTGIYCDARYPANKQEADVRSFARARMCGWLIGQLAWLTDNPSPTPLVCIFCRSIPLARLL